MNDKRIVMAHGSGGNATSELIKEVFQKNFKSREIDAMEDAAVLPGHKSIALTTDSFVVTPIFFPGGDIGRLSVCGTVNDLLSRGAEPKYITCGFIIEEGLLVSDLEKVAKSMAKTAREAGVLIACGDTKVIEGSSGLYINTAGVGFIKFGSEEKISAKNAKCGDVIILTGNLGDHHAALLSSRMSIKTDIISDNAPLNEIVSSLSDIPVHTIRDVTRGGLATVLKELSISSKKDFIIYEDMIPVSDKVLDFSRILGLDPLYMGNEGKMVIILPKEYEEEALKRIKSKAYGENACVIGEVKEGTDGGALYEKTRIGGTRALSVLMGEGLPRIC